MLPPSTLFVIGAGASCEAHLPAGKALIDIVASKLDYRVNNGKLDHVSGDPDVLAALQMIVHERREDIVPYLDAAKTIKEGAIFSNSIDSFIDVHKNDEKIQLCGKLAIGKAILEAERVSTLYVDDNQEEFRDNVDLRNTWFAELFRYLNDGVSKSEMFRIFEKIGFIVFNYDRCIEHFLFHTLQRHFGINQRTARQIMDTLRIIHPYGTIAELPWSNERDAISYGCAPNRANVRFMATRIRTYTERLTDDSLLEAIHKEVRNAHTIVFLGFSYHPQNMRLLQPEIPCATTQAFGTAYDISDNNREIVKQEVRKLIGKPLGQPRLRNGEQSYIFEPIFIENEKKKCLNLLQDYSRSLFFAGHPEH